MKPFTYTALPARVVFGFGTVKNVGDEIKRLGCEKALVLTTPQQVQAGENVKQSIGSLFAGMYTNATMHTPENVTLEAVEYAKKIGADCAVAVGGGSTIGLGKAIA